MNEKYQIGECVRVKWETKGYVLKTVFWFYLGNGFYKGIILKTILN